jgi:hypothetical protein
VTDATRYVTFTWPRMHGAQWPPATVLFKPLPFQAVASTRRNMEAVPHFWLSASPYFLFLPPLRLRRFLLDSYLPNSSSLPILLSPDLSGARQPRSHSFNSASPSPSPPLLCLQIWTSLALVGVRLPLFSHSRRHSIHLQGQPRCREPIDRNVSTNPVITPFVSV